LASLSVGGAAGGGGGGVGVVVVVVVVVSCDEEGLGVALLASVEAPDGDDKVTRPSVGRALLAVDEEEEEGDGDGEPLSTPGVVDSTLE